MGKITLSLIAAIYLFSSVSDAQILDFRKQLVTDGVTGSNVFRLFKDGEIVYDRAINSGAIGDADISDSTIFAIHSTTKTVTTVAMMILLEKGLCELDDELHKYLSEYENMRCKSPQGVYPCQNRIKIVDLLTHRSGYNYYAENGDHWVANMHRALYPRYINTARFNNLEDFSEAVSKQTLEFEPGSMFMYGLNQAILGRVIEVISEQEFYTFLRENIFDKLEMHETKFHLSDAERDRLQPLRVNIKPNTDFNQYNFNLDGYTAALDGYSYALDNKAHFGGEGLVSTLDDFSKFCEMLLNKGLYKGQRILSEKSIEIMTREYSSGYPSPDEPFAFSALAGYGYGFTFSVLNDPEVDGTGAGIGSYGWSGYHNTHFWIDPENNVYGLFMYRALEFNFSILSGMKKASYEQLGAN